MKRIAVAGPVGSPGGLQTHYVELRRFLAKAGHSLLAIDVHLPGAEVHNAGIEVFKNERHVAVRNSSGSKKAFDWLNAAYQVRRFNPEILVAVSKGYGYALLGMAAPNKCFSVRTEVTDSWKADDLMHRLMNNIYHAIGVQSPRLHQALSGRVPDHRLMGVIPCFAGIPDGPEISVPPASTNTPLKLAFFGRLAKNKGLVELVEAIAHGSIPPNATVDIWGRGPMADGIESLIRRHSLENIVRLKGGFPGGTEFPALLASYHGLLLPSQFSEGLPLVLLEAASVGLPFLSCDVGAIADCALDNPEATVVPVGSEHLSNELKKWCADLLARKFDTHRLKSWYGRHHSRQIHERIWNDLIDDPNAFFERSN